MHPHKFTQRLQPHKPPIKDINIDSQQEHVQPSTQEEIFELSRSYYWGNTAGPHLFGDALEITNIKNLWIDNLWITDAANAGVIVFLKIDTGITQGPLTTTHAENGLGIADPYALPVALHAPLAGSVKLHSWANAEGRIGHNTIINVRNADNSFRGAPGFITLRAEVRKHQ